MATFTYESVRNTIKGLTLSGTTTFSGAVNVGVNDTGYDFKMFGATSGSYWLWDESADGVVQIGTLTVGVDDAGHDVKFFGATASRYWLWDESADGVVQRGTLTVGQDDTGHDVTFHGATSGRNLTWDESADALLFTDSTPIKIGSGNDMQISHDGSNSYIVNSTGDFIVDATNDIILDSGGADIVLKDDGTQYASLNNSSGNLIIQSGSTTALTFSGANVTLAGDLTISGDDLYMNTNTSGYVLVADGTNYNPVAVSGDVTMSAAGAITIASGAVESGMLASGTIDSQTQTLFSVSGNATMHACRAWVTWNGGDGAAGGTLAVRDSANVSSVTDHSTGRYTVNFSATMPHANYTTQLTPGSNANGPYSGIDATMWVDNVAATPTTSAVRVSVYQPYSLQYYDNLWCQAAIFCDD